MPGMSGDYRCPYQAEGSRRMCPKDQDLLKPIERLTLTIPEAANALGISRGLAYEMARLGKLPTVRFGKRLVVPRRALERLLEQPEQASKEAQATR